MLKHQASTLRRVAITLDTIVLIGSFLFAYYLRKVPGQLAELHNYIWLLFFACPIWFILLNHYKIYESLRIRSNYSVVWALIKVHAIGGLMLAASIFLLDPHSYHRILFGYFLVLSFLLMSVCKVGIKTILHCFRGKGHNFRNILIIGSGQNALKMCELIHVNRHWGLNVVGMVEVTKGKPATDSQDCQVVGTFNEVLEICKANVVDEVVFAPEKEDPRELMSLCQDLQDMGITVRIIFDYLTLRSAKTEMDLFNNEIPMFTYRSISFNTDQMLAKRCMDIIGALAGLTVTAVILPVIALAAKFDSPGPIFFGQTRVRENGRRFICWKFRTMCVDAEAQKEKLMARNEMKGAMFKIKDDPRITKVGKFLRKTSLDELPQFWNVLKGEMSLVGTRPPTPDEVASYQDWHHKRIAIKPGITGMWQVSGRNQIQEFDDVVRLDLIYIETWSIWLDLKIIMKTPLVMLSRHGAS